MSSGGLPIFDSAQQQWFERLHISDACLHPSISQVSRSVDSIYLSKLQNTTTSACLWDHTQIWSTPCLSEEPDSAWLKMKCPRCWDQSVWPSTLAPAWCVSALHALPKALSPHLLSVAQPPYRIRTARLAHHLSTCGNLWRLPLFSVAESRKFKHMPGMSHECFCCKVSSVPSADHLLQCACHLWYPPLVQQSPCQPCRHLPGLSL